MESKTVFIPNISCGHCTRTIESEVKELEGVVSVSADIATKQATIVWDAPATWENINALLGEINYAPQQLIQL